MRRRLTNNELFNYLIDKSNEKFEGWDFSYIERTGRMQEFPLTWNYRNKVMREMYGISSLLDMGTGGGEFLSTLSPLPKYTCATEGYVSNISIARNRLEPLGVKVYKVEDDEELPFNDETFELVINKHESYSPKEVRRILDNNGIFITQQVGGLNDKEINEILEASVEFIDWNLKNAVAELEEVGLNIFEQREDLVKTRFYDIGAIVYYLKAIPWQVPDFTIEKYFDKLLKIHNMIEKLGYVDFTCHRFFIMANKE
ncbi:MAG: Methyltransf-11 domain-containing protein [Sporanaerobacter sp.]|jgi:SAM-dependent methyltransferase|uniref:class I SAM-dependent methyltransferase n=1 Tax=Sporanaerobacter sp. TaxID=2010183 RepID=UPI003A0FF045